MTPRRRGTSLIALLAASLAASATACGPSSTCESLCAEGQDADCADAPDGSCADACQAYEDEAAATGCQTAWDHVLDCTSDKDAICDSSCSAENNAYEACKTKFCAANPTATACQP